MSNVRVIRLALALLVVSCWSQLGAAAAALGNAAAIDSFLDQATASTRIPGLVALVVDRNGVIYTHAAGKRTAGSPMASDAIFNIASMTKPIGAAAIMMLVEAGKLSLDDPISKHLPEFAGKSVIATNRGRQGRGHQAA